MPSPTGALSTSSSLRTVAPMVAGSGGVDPVTALLAAGSGLAGGIAGAISNANNAKRTAQAQREAIQAQQQNATQNIAADESKLDPFRQQVSQAHDLFDLDRMERATYSPVHLAAAPGYESYVPQMSGGSSYTKSPELIAAAAALKRNILGGNVAPTMTDPTNYGKTAALNLLAIASANKDPGQVSGAVGAPRNTAAYTEGVQTREAGGLGTADTRSTDVSVQQAQQILDKAIRSELGRAPNPGEIDAMLKAQGLKPGDRWVGNAGLSGLINTLRAQAQQNAPLFEPSFTGRG